MNINKEELLRLINQRIEEAKQFGIPQFVLGLHDAKAIIEKQKVYWRNPNEH